MNFDILDPRITPFIIFFAKNIEVSLSSMRIISVGKGYRGLAMIIAGIEALVWVVSVSLIVSNLKNFYNIIAFSLGMSTGCYLGIYIEKKLALGTILVQLITQKSAKELLSGLRKVGFRVTSIDAESNYGKVQIILATIRRKSLNEFASLVFNFNPNAFFTIQDMRETSQIIKNASKKITKDLLQKMKKSSTQEPFVKKIIKKKASGKKSTKNNTKKQ